MKTMNQPELSIIIPVYNASSTLSCCVDSILKQSFINVEILLIDDGSTDNSASLCDEFEARDSRIRTIHQCNGGVSSARNKGLSCATGKWVAFIDSDDWIEEGYLAELIKYSNECQLIVSGFKRFGELTDEAKPDSLRSVDIKKELHILWGKSLDKFIFWYVWGKLFRMDVIRKYGITFNKTMKYNEDNCFVLEYMSHVDSFVFVPLSGYVHLYEKRRSQKYKMDFETFKIHVDQQEQSFLQLENYTGHRYSLVRQNVHRRFFDCFVYHLLKQKTYSSYKMEINLFKENDSDHLYLDEVSYSFNRRLLRLALFQFPSWIGYVFRHLFIQLSYQ